MTDIDRLFVEHRTGVFRYLCRMTGRPEAARDLTQEVFLRVTRAGVPDTDVSGRRAWVFRIARNLALNHLRDGQRRPETALVERAAPASQELALAIDRALGALNEVDRTVFLLREMSGLSYGEIAVACELTVTAVRSRLHRARLELRGSLKELAR